MIRFCKYYFPSVIIDVKNTEKECPKWKGYFGKFVFKKILILGCYKPKTP
jgi:hypothetical protein